MIKGLSFSNPSAVSLVPPLLLLLALLLVEMRRRQAFLKAFGDPPLVRGFSCLGPERSSWLRPLFLSLGLAAAVVALAGPAVGSKLGQDDPKPPDLVLLLDVSRSMGAEDYAPKLSRLGKAKAMIQEVLPDLAGARVGVATFAGAAFRQAPLTDDHAALKYVLANWVFIESAPAGGSNIAQGIRTAVSIFGGGQGERVVLLFSDGGPGGSKTLRSALAEARSNRIRIFTFGLGSPVGSKLPQYDSNGGFSGWLTADGEVVTTKLDEATMKEIAAATRGRYSRVISGRELRQTLNRLKILRARSQAEARELFQWPLAAALIFLFAERVSGGVRGLRTLGRRSGDATVTLTGEASGGV